MASSSTHLSEAIDWHIILMKFQQLAKKILSQNNADDYPLVSEMLQSLLNEHVQAGGRAPTLTFSLRMYFKSGGKHKLFRFFRTADLRWVLHCRTRDLFSSEVLDSRSCNVSVLSVCDVCFFLPFRSPLWVMSMGNPHRNQADDDKP